MYPCPTLQVQPHDCPRMARGQDGSLLLSCMTLPFTTPRRFIPTLSSQSWLPPPFARRRRPDHHLGALHATSETSLSAETPERLYLLLWGSQSWLPPPFRRRRRPDHHLG